MDGKAAFFRGFFLAFFNLFITKLFHTATLQADNMVVMPALV